MGDAPRSRDGRWLTVVKVRLAALLPLVVVALLWTLAVASAAPVRAGVDRRDERVVAAAGFERSLAGWAGFRASVRRVRGGISGAWALHVAFHARSRKESFSAYPRSPQAISVAGAEYSAGAWVKAPRRGRRLCLRLRVRAGGVETGGAASCVASTTAWQRLPTVSYRPRVSGRPIDVYVYEWKPKARDSFTLDRLTLATNAERVVAAGATAGDGGDRWYSSDSPFNQPIAADAATDPGSAAMVRALAAGAGGGFAISAKQWTPPVYYADAATPRVAVSVTMGWFPARRLIGVPMPANATPDATSDGHLMIVDRSTNCEYDFWQARRDSDGSWSASTANAIPMDGTGVFAGGWATTAAGFALGLGKIRPEELAAGDIEHALVFGFPTTKAGGPVAPATSSDGRSNATGAIPEGARLQLDPALDLDALGLTGWQKTVARALQRYGMILGDTGGTVGLSAVNASNLGANAYPWGDVDYAYLPTALLTHFRVIATGPQSSPPSSLGSNRCATYGF